MACNNSFAPHATIEYVLSILVAIFNTTSNGIFTYALCKTSHGRLTIADKLFICQSVFDVAACLIFFMYRSMLRYLSNNFCRIPTGWTLNQLLQHINIMVILGIFPMLATSMPGIISSTRCCKVLGHRKVAAMCLAVAVSIVSTTQIISFIDYAAGQWINDEAIKSISMTVIMCSITANLILLITANFMLLHHVLRTLCRQLVVHTTTKTD